VPDEKSDRELLPPPRTRLNRERRLRSVSQKHLSRATGISERNLQRLENGEIENPRLRYLVNCAKALGMDDWRELVEPEWEQWLPLPGGPKRARRAETNPGVY
jgi:transcriptional regulator with XRE-family HTH domain